MLFYLVELTLNYFLHEMGVTIDMVSNQEEFIQLNKHHITDRGLEVNQLAISNTNSFKGLEAICYLKRKCQVVASISLYNPLKEQPMVTSMFPEVGMFYDPEKTFELRMFFSEEYEGNEFCLLCLMIQCFKISRRFNKNRLLLTTNDKNIKLLHSLGCKTKFLFSHQFSSENGMATGSKEVYSYLIKSGKSDVSRVIKKAFRKKLMSYI